MYTELDLTKKQLIFYKEYLIDFNATRAATVAGFSEKTADSQGSRLLKNVKVKECIDKALKERSNKLDITGEKVLQEIASIAFFDIRDIYENNVIKEIDQLDEKTSKAISSIKVRREKSDGDKYDEVIEIKSNDKLRALEMLGKNIGIFEKDNDQKKGEIVVKVLTMGNLYEDK